MKRLLFAILLISATCLAQDYSSRNELARSIRFSDRMANDTFAVNDYTLYRLMNDAIRETDFKLRGWQKLDTIWTTEGTATYSLNSDCYHNGVVEVRILIDSTLGLYRSARSILTKDAGQTQAGTGSGDATWYYQYGNKITLEPTPQEIYRVELGYEARAEMYGYDDSDSTDTVLAILPEYEPMLIKYTRYLLKKRFGLENEAMAILNEWKSDVAEARALLQRRPDAMVSPEKELGQ